MTVSDAHANQNYFWSLLIVYFSLFKLYAKDVKVKGESKVILPLSPFHKGKKSSWQNRKDGPNRSTNNGDIVDKAKHDVVSDWVCDIYLIIDRTEHLIM